MKKTYNQEDTSFFTFHIISYFVLTWGTAIMITYGAFLEHNIYIRILYLLIVAYFLFHPLKRIYYRWVMFMYNKDTEFAIDSENGVFTYKHGRQEISFTSKVVEKWIFQQYSPAGLTTFAEIIEFHLKDGEKITISSGVGKDLELYYELVYNHMDLGLPEGEHESEYDISKYIEDIS